MKKNIIFSLLFLTAIAANSQNIRINENTTISNGILEIKVVADEDINKYIATGFCVEIPDGFSLLGAECEKGVNVKSDHLVRSGATDDECLRIAIYSLTNSSLSLDLSVSLAGEGQSGGGSGGRARVKETPVAEEGILGSVPLTLCSIKLNTPTKPGTYQVRLSNIEYATSNHELVKGESLFCDIIIKAKGDVNGDDVVNAQDVVDLIMYIIGENDLDFNAADVNGDGVINSADVIMVSNSILKN